MNQAFKILAKEKQNPLVVELFERSFQKELSKLKNQGQDYTHYNLANLVWDKDYREELEKRCCNYWIWFIRPKVF